MGLTNIDTGATYRCVTLEMLRKDIKLEEKEKIVAISDEIAIDIKNENGNQIIFLDKEDVTKEIRSKEVTSLVSQVSSIPEVREKW